ncbi:hypothetical protein FACS18949_12570 [Clostridia bacterium]|nr:hypothetical protein FACS18949_12570 [Clostridia bacterium]
MQDVVVSIKGRQAVGDWEFDEFVELMTPGKLENLGGEYVITYQESELTGMKGTETTLKVAPRCVTLTRTGSTSSEMVFEQGCRHLSYKDFGMDGGAAVGVNAHRVAANFDERGGQIDVEYAVEVGNIFAGLNALNIEVKYVN